MKTSHQTLRCLVLLGLAILNAHLSSAFAQAVLTNWDNLLTNWVQTSAPSNYWISIASSADGTKLAAAAWSGGIYTSTNSGTTWTQTSAPSTNWECIASSADGTQLAAGAGNLLSLTGLICTSTNAGLNWTPQTNAPSRAWVSIASSADGTKLAAGVDKGFIYSSTNAGITWTNAPGYGDWLSIASSQDGTKLAAVSVAYFSGIITSLDSGVTWHLTTLPGYSWWSVASSSDGTMLAAVANGGPIYTSTNSGATWSPTSAPNKSWYSIASSADGTRLAAGVYQGGFYISSNSGSAWTQTSLPSGEWVSVASSADGTKLVAVDNSGGIWTAQATIHTNPPTLFISQSSSTASVYWQTAAGWVLQQSSNLALPTGWSPSSGVTSSNGTSSLTVTNPTGSLFFRLQGP